MEKKESVTIRACDLGIGSFVYLPTAERIEKLKVRNLEEVKIGNNPVREDGIKIHAGVYWNDIEMDCSFYEYSPGRIVYLNLKDALDNQRSIRDVQMTKAYNEMLDKIEVYQKLVEKYTKTVSDE